MAGSPDGDEGSFDFRPVDEATFDLLGRFGGRNTLGDQFVDGQDPMQLEFLIDVGGHPTAAGREPEDPAKGVEHEPVRPWLR